MIDLLRRVRLGIGGTSDAASATGTALAKAAELLARFTITVAGRIDAALSTIPAASDYTSARAAKLDETGVKSSQHIEHSMASADTTATITSVSTSKSVVAHGGHTISSDTTDRNLDYTVQIESATTVRLKSIGAAVAVFCVIEWE